MYTLALAALLGSTPFDADLCKTHPFAFSMTLDRTSYLEWEGVFAEWSLTNVSRRDVTILKPWDSYIDIRGIVNGDEAIRLEEAGTFCCWRRPRMRLRAGQTLRFSMDLRDYCGWRGPGRYCLSATYRLVIVHSEEEGETVELHSKDLCFDVCSARNEVRLGESIRQRWPEPESVFAATYRNPDWFIDAHSPRLQAAGYFYKGWMRSTSTEEWDVDRKLEGIQLLKACVASEGSSRYLKGLARLKILEAQRCPKSDADRRHALKLADDLRRDYPGSYMEQEARGIRASLLENPSAILASAPPFPATP